MTCCTTCGQSLPASRLLVDLNTNRVTLGTLSVKLRPRDAEVLQVLHDAAPRYISPGDLEIRVLGTEAGERCSEWVRVRISMLRKKLEGFPLRIENNHGTGYRLVEVAA